MKPPNSMFKKTNTLTPHVSEQELSILKELYALKKGTSYEIASKLDCPDKAFVILHILKKYAHYGLLKEKKKPNNNASVFSVNKKNFRKINDLNGFKKSMRASGALFIPTKQDFFLFFEHAK